MLLINIALVVWIVVYNNSYVIVNNIDVWNNQEEVFTNIYNKWNIAIESIKKYNSNGWSYVDGLSCPTNITMSGTTNRQTNLNTTLVEEYWETYCEWTYFGKEFRIYYDDSVEDFDRAVFWDNIWWSDSVSLSQSIWTTVELSNDNIASDPSTSVTYPARYSNYYGSHINDENDSTHYESYYRSDVKNIEFDFGRELKIWKIVLKKINRWNDWEYWANGRIDFKDSFRNIDYAKRIDIYSWMNSTSYEEYNLWYSGLANETQFLEIRSYYGYLDVSEIEVYELLSTWSEEEWQWDRNFYDGDSTLITFDTDWIHGDWIDDDLNSDNYKVTSRDNIYFPNGYQDDDVVPRKTIFWSIPANKPYQHVYWNNYRTIEIIKNNTNNDDILNMKMSDVSDAHVFINTFNTEDLDYDIKILEFDRDVYKDQFTLLPKKSYEWKNIDKYLGYLQLNSWDNSLWVAKEKTWNEFEFDFQNKDYAIFFANNTDSLLSYHLEAYTPTWTGIYINPIDDSWTGTISVLSNHIIIWWEKNFIWENFEVVWSK